jgi:hypothetical protein
VLSPKFDYFDFDELARLLDSTNGDAEVLAAVLAAADAGLRVGEVRALEWQNVDFKGRRLTVTQTDWRGKLGSPKGGRLRTLDLTARLAMRHLRGPFVFCDADGARWTQKAQAFTGIERGRRRAWRAAAGASIHVNAYPYVASASPPDTVHCPRPGRPAAPAGRVRADIARLPWALGRVHYRPMVAQEILGGRFQLEELAGAGAMGEVYRAVDLISGRRVALKILRGRNGDDLSRFVREARILAELRHPYIVGHVDHGATAGGVAWLAMDWLEGEDLATRLRRGPLSVADSVNLAMVVAEALGFIHARGIVHRDLKPSNVFLVNHLVSRGTLLDFGIVHIEAAERMTRKGMVLGTPGYMAPEQVRGGAAIDSRADVYSLGCLLFECLTSTPLFSGASILAVLAKVVFEPAPRVRDWLPDVPEELESLLVRMLAKEPDGRPADGQAVAATLRALGDLGEARAAPARAVPGTPALTRGEQRAVAVILVGAAEEGPGDGAAARPDTLDPAIEANLRAEAELQGGRFVRLLNGAVAVELSGPALATDLAAQAARAALSLRAQVTRRVALAIGRAEAAAAPLHGPAIDRAAKLLAQLSSPQGRGGRDGVLLDEVQAGLLDARFDVRQIDGVPVLFAERVLGESTRTLLGKATPFVGREPDLGILEQLFDACAGESAAHAVLVTAQAGVGKSRLAQEFLRQVRARADRATKIWIARGDALRAGSAFGLLGQLLRGACDVRDGESIESRRDKIRTAAAARLPEGERSSVAEFLGELMGSPFPDEDNLPLRAARRDTQLMNDRMQAAFLKLVGAECEKSPLLIVLEDLHWGDRPTVQFLDRALAALKDRPLFVLGLARPEASELFPRLWAERGAHELRLKALGPRAIERLARHSLGDEATPATVHRLAALSDGNAFYLEELIRWAAERRAGPLPETLVTMVQSRLGTLDDESRRVLRVASVFGETFWLGALGPLLGSCDDTAALGARLKDLSEREVLIERSQSRFPDTREYAFRHALLREGAYAMLTHEDRALGHRLAGDWLESHGEADPLLLAEHLEKGGEGVRAAMQYLLAARRASAGSDTTRALECVERGLSLSLPRALRIRLMGLRCELHMYRIEMALAGLPQARALLGEADRGGAAWTQALLLTLIAAAQTGNGQEVAQALDAAVGADFQPEAVEAATILLGFGVAFSDHAGEVRRSAAMVKRSESLVRPQAEAQPGAALFHHLIITTRAAFAEEDPWAGLEHARRALVLAQSIGHTRYALGSRMLIVVNSCFLGRRAEARQAASEWDVPDREFGLSSSVRPFVLSWMLADMGLLDDSRAWAQHLIAAGKERRLPLDEARGHWALAEVLRRMGERAAADAAIGTALAMLDAACPLDRPGALATLSALRREQGKIAEAVEIAAQGMDHYRSMGACGMFRGAFLRMTHAEALRAAGRAQEARTAIVEAWRCVSANAQKVGDPSFRTSFLEDVDENRRTRALVEAWSS